MLRFTIRDVLWLTVVVALLLAWLRALGRIDDCVYATHHVENQLAIMASKWAVEKGEPVDFRKGERHVLRCLTVRLRSGPKQFSTRRCCPSAAVRRHGTS